MDSQLRSWPLERNRRVVDSGIQGDIGSAVLHARTLQLEAYMGIRWCGNYLADHPVCIHAFGLYDPRVGADINRLASPNLCERSGAYYIARSASS